MTAREFRVPTSDGSGRLWAERDGHGDGTGSPVVLLHGAGMDSRLWDAVVPELARHHDVIRYDARGWDAPRHRTSRSATSTICAPSLITSASAEPPWSV